MPLVALTAVSSFRPGQSERYPDEARQLVKTIQIHAREVKRIKSEISEARQRFTTPEDMLAIESNVFALKEHIDGIDTLTHQFAHFDEVPVDIGQMMNLLRQAMPTEKRQIANIESQLAVVRSTQSLSPEASF